ncbi:Thiamine biosynthesis protein ThiP [Candidatus Desulfarcum epimagneticum]|uniref:Thiamine biosynthesis protein ThiP n=1 Tax=uncultured Desulfobacteraceae bacterium TaxID=218296 RepID=A0A484HCP8_9BACT|nr:Thiamine biosynthesis protein ThiP [uncultured Desulfobacteraceae bacterium]
MKPLAPFRRELLFLIPPLVFLGAFYFYPLSQIFKLSFFSAGDWGTAPLTKLLTAPFFFKILWFTTWQAAVSTLLTFALALPGAYVFCRYDFWGKNALKSFFTIPFVLPTVAVAAGFRALGAFWGFSAPGEGSIWMILAAHVFYNYAVVLRMVEGFWKNIAPGAAEAARTLGASPVKAFVKITLPLLRPVLAAAGLLVFVFCFSSFGVILVLGGTRFSTIEVEIYRQAAHIFNLPAAAALSLVQILFTFPVMWVHAGIQRRSAVPLTPGPAARRRPAGVREKITAALPLGLASLFLGAPLAALAAASVSGPDGLSFVFYRALTQNPADSVFFAPPLESALLSFQFAAAAMVMAAGLALPAALFLSRAKGLWSAFFDPVFMLPLSTSAVTLGFGFIIALDRPPLNLRAGVMLIPIAHALVAFPFATRILLPAMRGVPQILRDAAAVLGASSFRVWRAVDLPAVSRAMVAAGVFAFTISMGEFGAAAFVARPDAPTLPVAIYRFLGQPGALNHGQAMAMSCLLMAFSAAGFLLMDRAGAGWTGDI